MKKILKEEDDEDKLQEFYEVLNSYSEYKFNAYISLQEVKYLINIVFSEIKIEEFIESHQTLMLNRDSYIKHIKSLINMM